MNLERTSMRRRAVLAAGPFAAALAPVLGRAQPPAGFPLRPITLVVSYPAASTNDVLARLLAAEVAPRLGRPVPVDNRPGAGGTLGTGSVVQGRADGYTVLLVSTSTIAINRALYRNLAYDPARDLVPVSIGVATPSALIVPGASPFHTLAQLLERGRDASQLPLRYFSPGNGTSQHLLSVQLLRAGGIRSENITYRGSNEGIAALIAGETDWGFSAVPSVVGLVREGRLRALGVTGTRPPTTLPDVGTFGAQGLPGFDDTDVWFGIAAPRETPPEVLAVLRRAFEDALASPALRERLAAAGFASMPPLDGPAMEAFIARQVAYWGELVRESGATIE